MALTTVPRGGATPGKKKAQSSPRPAQRKPAFEDPRIQKLYDGYASRARSKGIKPRAAEWWYRNRFLTGQYGTTFGKPLRSLSGSPLKSLESMGPADPVQAPMPSMSQPDPAGKYGQYLDLANEALQIFQAAEQRIKYESGERRSELQNIANTARSQIDQIYAEMMPEMQEYANSLRDLGMPDAASGDGRMQMIVDAGKHHASANEHLAEQGIDIETQQALSANAQDRDMYMLGLQKDALQDSTSEAKVTQYEIEGFLARQRAAGLSEEQARDETIAWLESMGVNADEAYGRVSSAAGTNRDGGAAQELALAKALEIAARNRGKHGKDFTLDREDLVRQIRTELRRHGYDPAVVDLDWVVTQARNAYAQQEVERTSSRPDVRSNWQRFKDLLNPTQ